MARRLKMPLYLVRVRWAGHYYGDVYDGGGVFAHDVV